MSSANPQPPPVVLVVEDDYLIRLNAVELIENAGFDVIEATDADQAIEFLLARNDIRVVFTDVDMPGSMDGLKLAAAVRNRWPPIEIIVTSGKVTPAPEAFLPEVGSYPSRIAQIASSTRSARSRVNPAA